MSWLEPTKIEFARMCEEALREAIVEVWDEIRKDWWRWRVIDTFMLPTTPVDWSKMGTTPPLPALPEKKPEPLPSFHHRPRQYRRDGTYEEIT